MAPHAPLLVCLPGEACVTTTYPPRAVGAYTTCCVEHWCMRAWMMRVCAAAAAVPAAEGHSAESVLRSDGVAGLPKATYALVCYLLLVCLYCA